MLAMPPPFFFFAAAAFGVETVGLLRLAEVGGAAACDAGGLRGVGCGFSVLVCFSVLISGGKTSGCSGREKNG